jgi:hypothetical protein
MGKTARNCRCTKTTFAQEGPFKHFEIMRQIIKPGLFPALKNGNPFQANKFRKKYRQKTEEASPNLSTNAPVMKPLERHQWANRYASKRFWIHAMLIIIAIAACTVLLSLAVDGY